MPKSSGPPPHVTGVSPNEGTPGTKLTIRGEHLGQTASDLTHVFINQIDVGPTAHWFSPSRISAITPLGEGELEIVVVTNNDKFGTASVSYHQGIKRSEGPQTPVTYWPPDERRYCPAIYEHGHGGSSSASATSTPGGELDPSTGLPMSELTRISIPLADSALRDIYTGTGSVQLTDKDFDPLPFLLKFYKNSSFNDLTVTFNNFRKSMHFEGAGEPVNVIRTNLVLIFRCLDGMDSLRVRLVSEKQTTSGRQFQLPFESSLSESRNVGHSLFEGILKRRDRAESTLNAIGVMQRYQFLFNLPHAIRSDISKGDYSLVLNDYLRAKSLFANSDVEVLRRVYADVESVISNFRNLLEKQLTTMPIECDEAKRRIGYLQQLEVTFDPTWMCLLRFKDWLVEQLHGMRRPEPVVAPVDAPTAKENATGKRRSGLLSSRASIPPSDGVARLDIIGRSNSTWPMVGLFKSVRRLLSKHVVQFWRLGMAYTSSQLTHESVPARVVPNTPSNQNAPAAPLNRKAAWLEINLEFMHVLSNTIRDEVLETVGTTTKKDASVTEWLPQCIEQFRQCCSCLPLNELPTEIGEVFSRLAHDLRRHAVRTIFQRAQSSIEALQLQENWDTNVDDELGGTTKLPAMYEDIISVALDRCQDQVSPQTFIEKPLFDSAELRERFPDWCGDAMVAFLATLNRLADQIESTIPKWNSEEDGSSGRASWISVDSMGNRQSGPISIVTQARGLLLVLNNARLTHRANKRLLAAYQTDEYASPEILQTRCKDTWRNAIANLAARYAKLRATWLCAPIKPLLVEFVARAPKTTQWDLPLQGVHSFIRTMITNLSHVCAELILLLGSEELSQARHDPKEAGIRGVLMQIVSIVVEHLQSCSNEIEVNNLSRSVRLKLLLDFRAIRASLPQALFTSLARQSMDTICADLDGADEQEKRHLDGLLDKEKSRMRLLTSSLAALQPRRSVVLIREG